MTDRPRNVLFIMTDQLRWDYLSCAASTAPATPNIDALAARGVRFNRAYVQGTICGPSRMSFYTGTYMRSHGATCNSVPLRVDEWTLGDYLRPLGLRTLLVGKTHMRADLEGLARLGIDPASTPGRLIAECGFEVFERDDGLHPEPPGAPDALFTKVRYNQYLNALGYDGVNPWHRWANSWEDADGTIRSGWFLDGRQQACPRGGRAFRDAVHDDAARSTASKRRRARRGASISRTSSRIGRTSRRRPTMPCTAPATCRRRSAARANATPATRSTTPSCSGVRRARFRTTTFAGP